jgi:hypothetical protein
VLNYWYQGESNASYLVCGILKIKPPKILYSFAKQSIIKHSYHFGNEFHGIGCVTIITANQIVNHSPKFHTTKQIITLYYRLLGDLLHGLWPLNKAQNLRHSSSFGWGNSLR